MESQSRLRVERLLKLNKAQSLVSSWTKFEVLNKLSNQSFQRPAKFEYSDLLASIYRGAAVKLDDDSPESLELLVKSYDLWKTSWYSQRSEEANTQLQQLFHLTCTGLLIDSFAEVRMILLEQDLEDIYERISRRSWPEFLETTVYLILLILVRKGGGWEDLRFIECIIKDIQRIQESLEEKYFEAIENGEGDIHAAVCWVGAFLNVLEALEAYKKFMINGTPDNVDKVIIRFIRDAVELIEKSHRSSEVFSLILLEKTLLKLINVSVWSSVQGISDKIDTYIELLTIESNSKPIFELWPSQQRAVAQNLFDNSKTAIVVQMPTSAGKTLLAKFYMLQTMNLFSDAKVAYIVPTRALVNQVKNDLRRDFACLTDIRVEVAIPYSEVDEIEDSLLLKKADIIVTTPEKLDVLLRTKHPLISKLRLVVVDEAHSIQGKSRGARLELLLAMLRKEKRNLRILMLSPFMSNAKKISNWLSGSRGHDIFVDWKPAQQYTGTHQLLKIKRGSYEGIVEYIPSSLNTMYRTSFRVPIYHCKKKAISKIEQAAELAKVYRKTGGVLVLCLQRGYAEAFCKLFLDSPNLNSIRLEKLTYILDLIEAEMGTDCLLYNCIQKGVAYHHSSLSLMVREEIEAAIASRLLDVVAATTTLAQGMNFPISTVIFQGMGISEGGYTRPMDPSEFWNIAGRAGRALTDKEGHVIAVTQKETEIEQFNNYLSNKNQEVISSLLGMLDDIPEDGLDTYWLERCKPLSSLLQYIYHIILVDKDIEIEDILRATLVYNQLNDMRQKPLAEKLVRLTKNYMDRIKPDRNKKKLMESIDKSGLSSISMHKLIGLVRQNPSISITSDKLFGNNIDNLQTVIEIVHKLPELSLNMSNSGSFDAKLVANITKDWVNGLTIREIAERNIKETTLVKTIDDKIDQCGKYIYSTLVNNLPWGISAVLRAKGIVAKQDLKEDIVVPSYVYFGVKSREAVAFSMLGVPRFASIVLAQYWRKEKGEVRSGSIEFLEEWLAQSTQEDWKRIFSKQKKGNGIMAYISWKRQSGIRED